MQDNQKKYRKKYAVMTVFFLISASFLFGCGNKDSAVPETEEFLFSAEEEKSDHTSQKSEEPAEKAERKKAEADSGTVEENPERKKVFVYVCGEVQASGVYELEQDSRVFEAIAKAGGLTENAAAEAVNQARVVVDGEQIYVPSLDEVKGAGVVSEVTERTDDGKININTAEKEEQKVLFQSMRSIHKLEQKTERLQQQIGKLEERQGKQASLKDTLQELRQETAPRQLGKKEKQKAAIR